MAVLPRLFCRRLILLAVFGITFLVFNMYYQALPPNSAIRLAVNFNTNRASSYLHSKTGDRDEWFTWPQTYPRAVADTAFLIKTSYGTKQRLPEQLDAFKRTGNLLGIKRRRGTTYKSFLVVGDWAVDEDGDSAALGADVIDAVGAVMGMDSFQTLWGYPAFEKYRSLQMAIDQGKKEEALKIAERHWSEFDAFKSIYGLESLLKEYPDKDWYVILNDDTFVVKSTLAMILSRLDPSEPLYFGNAIGDFKTRFAHGGSGIVISGTAMRLLFSHPEIIAEAYIDSLEGPLGDKVIAMAFQKLGLYLEERFSHHFNGDSPLNTKISADKFCSPIVSFGGLGGQGDMIRLADVLEESETKKRADGNPGSWYLRWGGVWDLFDESHFADIRSHRIRRRKDHVGSPDEHTKTWTNVASSESCRERCAGSQSSCLAWNYDEDKSECRGSPGMIIGDTASLSLSSGVIWDKIAPLVEKCF